MADIFITPSAAQRIQQLVDQNPKALGLRLAVRKSGCSGYGYQIELAQEITATDLLTEQHGAKVVIEKQFLSMLQGLTIDFVSNGLTQMFSFRNPNAKDQCGCGESFTV